MTRQWLTVVTIVKDDPVGLARTAESLAVNDLTDVEHVVVDGSTEVVPLEALQATRARVVHQVPQGVYSAMNAGLYEATAEYVWFLNAGDEVLGDDVITRLRRLVRDVVWAHAPVIVMGRDHRSLATPPWSYSEESKRLFARGRFPAHQGTIASVDALRDLGGFDTRYRICADYKIALELSKLSDPVEISFPIARFHEGGLSTIDWRKSVIEFHRARREVFHPRGRRALVEYLHMGRQWIALGTYRAVIEPIRSRLSR